MHIKLYEKYSLEFLQYSGIFLLVGQKYTCARLRLRRAAYP